VVLNILDNGKESSDKVKVLRYGKMEQSIQANGKTEKLMGMESSFMFSVISMKEIGSVIKLMVKESSHMSMDRRTMEPGRMTFNIVKVSNTGMITPNTTEHTIKVTNTDMEATHGQMAPITQVNGFKTESKAKAHTLGKTEEFT